MTARELEQIQAILDLRSVAWALDQDPEGEMLYDQVFTITEAQVLDYVYEHGFNPAFVTESDSPATCGVVNDEHIVICPNEGQWAVFYCLRGTKRDVEHAPTLEEVRRIVVRKFIETARTLVDYRVTKRLPSH